MESASRVIGTETFGRGSAIMEEEDFIAENITFENSSPKDSGQAIAIRVTADSCAFYNCQFLGWQITRWLAPGSSSNWQENGRSLLLLSKEESNCHIPLKVMTQAVAARLQKLRRAAL